VIQSEFYDISVLSFRVPASFEKLFAKTLAEIDFELKTNQITEYKIKFIDSFQRSFII